MDIAGSVIPHSSSESSLEPSSETEESPAMGQSPTRGESPVQRPSLCISEPRCRLCQLLLDDGDIVVVEAFDLGLSQAFPFHRGIAFFDELITKIGYAMRAYRCMRFGCVHAPCFHYDCYFSRIHDITNSFLNNTSYSFRPPLAEDKRRKERTQLVLAAKLKTSFESAKLPIELWRVVAGHLVRFSLAVTGQELVCQDSVDDNILDICQDMYARYVIIDGIKYIKSLRNHHRSTPEPGEKLLFEARSGTASYDIHFSQDAIGIRHFQIDPQVTPCRIPGLWWMKFTLPEGVPWVEAKTDGFKLRDLWSSLDPPDGGAGGPPMDRLCWSTPVPEVTVINLMSLQNIKDFPTLAIPEVEGRWQLNTIPRGVRMCSFVCNGPRISGYYAAMDGACMTTIQAHTPDTDFTIYNELDDFFGYAEEVWIYMPVDEGEYITEISRRFGSNRYKRDSVGLTFVTNRGRETEFGPHILHLLPPDEHNLEIIHIPPRNPSTIYFNEWDSLAEGHCFYTQLFGFETTTPVTTRPNTKPALSKPPCPEAWVETIWFYSSCPLQDIVELTLCVDKISCHHPIIGMLLRYNDNHRECVGQFRLDWIVDPITVDPLTMLHIRTLNNDDRSYVTQLEVSSLEKQYDSSWLDIPWSGTLEWWFTQVISEVNHRID